MSPNRSRPSRRHRLLIRLRVTSVGRLSVTFAMLVFSFSRTTLTPLRARQVSRCRTPRLTNVHRLLMNVATTLSISSVTFYYSGVPLFSSDRAKTFSRLTPTIIAENNVVVGVEVPVRVRGI